jgi:hypothetical protein
MADITTRISDALYMHEIDADGFASEWRDDAAYDEFYAQAKALTPLIEKIREEAKKEATKEANKEAWDEGYDRAESDHHETGFWTKRLRGNPYDSEKKD